MQAISGPKRKIYSNEIMMQTSFGSFTACCGCTCTHVDLQAHMEPFSTNKMLPLTQDGQSQM